MKEKWLWWLVILVILAGVVIYFSKTPSTGKINYQAVKSPTPSPMEFIRYDGPDFSFAYENKYELRQNGSSFELVGKTGVTSQVVIMVNAAKSSNIEDVPGVLMRREKPEVYSESTVNWGETPGILFGKTDGSELTAFFLKDGKAVTVAMTANTNDNTGMKDEFQKLVDSMTIKSGG
jgi:hypothetical protein